MDPVTSTIYHIEQRANEGGRLVIVDTEKGVDVFGEGWNARNGVHEVRVLSRMNVYRALTDLIALLSTAEDRLRHTTA